eukprot:TRINITY_DN6132_c0_g2_i11.p1 TRINITY_DN6132_c0_g2~~TRINITY_DN6132_c0_g2_i11.p1  ORF type:complete len:475 (-),score=126.46 TRINITY_DN6132_c0_g2_i11:185-1609(-)
MQGNAAAAVDAVGATAGGTGTVVSLIGGASMLDLHTLAMLLNSPCASLLDQKRVNFMMYIVSPFYSLGNVAVVFGNMGVTALVTLLQVLMAWFFRNSRNIPTLAACAAVYFPSLAMKVAELMYVGVTVGAFSLLSESSTPVEVAVGVIGMLYVVCVPASVLATIHFRVTARMIQYTQFLSRPFLQRLMLPWGFWTPEAQERAYGRHIGGFLPGFRMYLSAYPMVVVGAAAIFTHLLPRSVDCFLRFTMAAIVFIIAAIAVLGVRPHRIHATTGFASAMFLVLGILSIVLGLAYQSPSEVLELAKLILCGVGVLLTILRVIFDGVTTYLEWKYWRHFREQNRDAMNDDGVVGSASERMAYELGVDGLDELMSPTEQAPKRKGTRSAKQTNETEQPAVVAMTDLVKGPDDDESDDIGDPLGLNLQEESSSSDFESSDTCSVSVTQNSTISTSPAPSPTSAGSEKQDSSSDFSDFDL